MKFKQIILSLLALTLTGCGGFNFATGPNVNPQTSSSSNYESSSSSSSSSSKSENKDNAYFNVNNAYVFDAPFKLDQRVYLDITLQNGRDPSNELNRGRLSIISYDSNIMAVEGLFVHAKNPGYTSIEITYTVGTHIHSLFLHPVVDGNDENYNIICFHIAIPNQDRLLAGSTYPIDVDIVLENGKDARSEYEKGNLALFTTGTATGEWTFDSLSLYQPGILELCVEYGHNLYSVQTLTVYDSGFAVEYGDVVPDEFGDIVLSKNTVFDIEVGLYNGLTLEKEFNKNYFKITSSNPEIIDVVSIRKNTITFSTKESGDAYIKLSYGYNGGCENVLDFLIYDNEIEEDEEEIDLFNFGEKVFTTDIINSDAGADAFSIWTENQIIHNPNGWVCAGWRSYLIFDDEGDLAYGVINPVAGFGAPNEDSYLRHAKYANYEDNPAIELLEGFGPWEPGGTAHNQFNIVVPEGGFAIISHGTAMYEINNYLFGGETNPSNYEQFLNHNRNTIITKAFLHGNKATIYYPKFAISNNERVFPLLYNSETQCYELKNYQMRLWNRISLFYDMKPLVLENLNITGDITRQGSADWTKNLYYEDIKSNTLFCSYGGTVEYDISYCPSTNTLHIEGTIIE